MHHTPTDTTCLHTHSLNHTRTQGLLQRLGPIAAAAAIFLGGYGTGLATTNMYGDIQSAEQHRVAEAGLVAAPAPARVPLKQTSLTMPDQVCAEQCVDSDQAAGSGTFRARLL